MNPAGGRKNGLFIAIEGADGCGKSTHARLLADYLKSKGHDVVATQEPTTDFIGQAIRSVLKGHVQISPETLTLLFTADRAEHVDKVISPALKAKKTVITDRFYYSTIAYQSVQGISEEWISQLNSFVPEPDIVLVLSIEPKEALARITGRRKEVFEVLDFQTKVQQKLLDLARGANKRLSKPGKVWKVIKNPAGETEVQAEIREFVDSQL